MTIRASITRPRGQPSGNREVYRRSFVTNVHRLLAAGYARLDPKSLQNKEEMAITGLLVHAMRDAIEGKERLSWAARYTIHDDPPVQAGQLEGKRRPRVDIEVESTHVVPHPRFQFEAKPLYRSDSVAAYVGTDGLGCFLSGRYASGHDDAGMLGYVQRGAAGEWIERIHAKLNVDRAEFKLAANGVCWRVRPTITGLKFSFQSTHARPGKPIDIHHTFLICH